MTSLSDALADALGDALGGCARQAALDQRARLLDAVWDDVQGERRAVRQGALPAGLLSGMVQASAALATYAADLIYCSDGVWRVARDYVGQHPGARLLEAPVLAAFLPGLCRLLLGEGLRLASLPVWWLGETNDVPISAVQSRRFFVRDGFNPESQAIVVAELPAEERPWLQAMVDADPCRFIAGLSFGWMAPVRQICREVSAAR